MPFYRPARAGRYRQRVQIQAPTETRGTSGKVTRSWSTLATVWAQVEPLRGVELFEAQKVNARITHVVRMRPYAGLTARHRLVLVT